MKKHPWLYLFAAFWMFVALGVTGFRRANDVLNAKIEMRNFNINSGSANLATLQQELDHLGSLNRDRDQYNKYRDAWLERLKTYNTRAAIETVFRETTAAKKLALAEPSEKNRVIENNATNFRVEWHVIGTADKVVEWLAELETKVDLLSFVETDWKSHGDQQVQVGCEAVIKLPEA